MILARLFVIVGGLIVLALTAALVGPYFVDWTSYRADFEREASAILGRKVTVEGEATARLLPFPSVTFSDVAVGGGPDGEPAMTVETFSMDAELAPFLRGEFLIFDMRLVRPKATIDVAADGTVDWAVRPVGAVRRRQISLEKLTITEGQVDDPPCRRAGARIGCPRSTPTMSAQVAGRSVAGRRVAAARRRADGARRLSTGTVDEHGQHAAAAAGRAGRSIRSSIEADGNVRLDKGAAGLFRAVQGVDEQAPRDDGASAGSRRPGRSGPGYRLNGKFSLDHERLAIDEFRFETGPLDNPYTADGNGLGRFRREPRFAIEATARRCASTRRSAPTRTAAA